MVDIGQASSSESVATLLYMRTCLMSASPPQFLPETKGHNNSYFRLMAFIMGSSIIHTIILYPQKRTVIYLRLLSGRGGRRGPHCGRTVLLPGCLIPSRTGATVPLAPPEQNLRQNLRGRPTPWQPMV